MPMEKALGRKLAKHLPTRLLISQYFIKINSSLTTGYAFKQMAGVNNFWKKSDNERKKNV